MDWRKHLAKLPEHVPRPDLWDRIEAELALEKKLDEALPQLPEHEPDDLLWQRIAQGLPQAAPWWQRGSARAAAASVAAVLLAVAWWHRPMETVTVEYRQEVAAAPPVAVAEPETAADQKAEAFIAQQCAEQATLCQKPEVKELRRQLAELDAETRELAEHLKVFGQDEALVKAQIKIENQRAAVTKELIGLLRI